MPYEWDETKNCINKSKHGISFEKAVLVFEDPFLLIIPSNNQSPDEVRLIALGSISKSELTPTLVVFTIRNGATRIISAHKPREKYIKMYLANVYDPSN